MTKKMSSDSATLLAELDALLRLTRAEAQIARVRVAQARRDDIRMELEDNAAEADRRAARIQAAIRRLGGVRDVFADAAGRVAVFTKTAVEQGQPFSEGLLGDLALEHQLRDRAQFARVLAEAQDEAKVASLLQDLEDAHTETIEWIRVRLAEVAQGEPGLAPTAAQAVVAKVTQLALMPVRQGADLFNRTVNLVERGRDKAEQQVEESVDRAQANVKATREVLAAGRDAALARAEEVAPSKNVRDAAHEAREDLGTIDAEDLPVKNYDELTAPAAIDEINKLDDAEDVRVVLRFEHAHKDRKGVSTAAEQRLSELAAESVTA